MPGVLRLSLMLLISDRLPIADRLAESSGISALNVSKLSRWWKWTLASANDIVSNASMIMAGDSVNGSLNWTTTWLLVAPPEAATALGSSWLDVWGDSGPVCAGGAPPPTAEALSDWSLPDGGSMIDNSAQSNDTCTAEDWRTSDHRNYLSLLQFYLPSSFNLLVLFANFAADFWKFRIMARAGMQML